MGYVKLLVPKRVANSSILPSCNWEDVDRHFHICAKLQSLDPPTKKTECMLRFYRKRGSYLTWPCLGYFRTARVFFGPQLSSKDLGTFETKDFMPQNAAGLRRWISPSPGNDIFKPSWDGRHQPRCRRGLILVERGFMTFKRLVVFCSTNIFWGRLLMMVILKQFLVGSSFHTKPV